MFTPLSLPQREISWSDVSYNTDFMYQNAVNENRKLYDSLNKNTCYCFILFVAVCTISFIIFNNVINTNHTISDGDYSNSGSYS